jgi:hypothetical protein
MADFQETAREKIKQLSAKRAETRREAAYYLGEAGHDEAITRLAWLYKNDPDKSVRDAAKYALGQFRAVELALKRGDEERVVGLLEGIVNDGKMGHRLKTRPSRLGLYAVILLILFVILLAAAVVIPGKRPLPGPLSALKLPGGSSVQPAASGPTTVSLDQIQPVYSAIQADAQTLAGKLQAVLTGGTLDCTAFLNGTSPIVFDGDTTGKPELAAAIQTINDAQAAVQAAATRYQEACFQSKPLEPSELGGLMGPLLTAERDLPLAQQIIATQEAIAQMSPTPSLEPSITPAMAVATDTGVPVTATPALNGANLVPLYDLVSTMTDPRGPNRLLQQYWQDGKVANRTDGCNLNQPDIPDNYTLPEGTTPSEQLSQAVALVNEGLNGVRRNWADFEAACAARTLSQSAARGLQIADAADQAFMTAAVALDNVRKGQ